MSRITSAAIVTTLAAGDWVFVNDSAALRQITLTNFRAALLTGYTVDLAAGVTGTLPLANGGSAAIVATSLVNDAREVWDCAITSGDATLTSATAVFVAGDVGKRIVVYGAGAADVPLVTTILSRTSATTVELSVNAGATVSAARFVIGTDNTAALQTALTAAKASSGRLLYLPAGTYAFESQVIVPAGIRVIGQGPGDLGGYEPWTGAPFLTRLLFTGTDARAIHLPQCATNSFEDFELAGNSAALGSGIASANAAYVAATTTNGSPIITLNGRSGIGFKVGDLIECAGVATGTSIAATISSNSFTMSANATATAELTVNNFRIRDGSYPGGTNYEGFNGNHLDLRNVYVHSFGCNFFSHHLGGLFARECHFGNAKYEQVQIEKASDTILVNCYYGGRETHEAHINSVCLRLIEGYSGVRIIGAECFQGSKVAEIITSSLDASGLNCEQINAGPYFDLQSGDLILSQSRLALARDPTAIPVRCHTGSATLNNVGMLGANHSVIAQSVDTGSVNCVGLVSTLLVHTITSATDNTVTGTRYVGIAGQNIQGNLGNTGGTLGRITGLVVSDSNPTSIILDTRTSASRPTQILKTGNGKQLLFAYDEDTASLLLAYFNGSGYTIPLTIDLANNRLLSAGGIGVGNRVAATTLGSVTGKTQIFDASGTSLGYVPIYGSIT